jgi:L-ascorbate metabolism protein UlaG (beta-lactamase superfamily)
MDTLSYPGHATALMRLGGATLITDPILRRNLGPLRRHGPPVDLDQAMSADVVLVSHLHRDHLDMPSLKRLPARTPVVVPRGAGRLVARAGASEIVEVSPGESISIAGLEVTATQAVHDGHRDPWGRQVQPVGYLLEGGGRRVYFAGDTDLFDEMESLRPLDLALIPVWGWGPTLGEGHLDPVRAADSLQLLCPRIAVPIHWGTLYPLGLGRFRSDRLTQPPLEFARAAADAAPEVEIRILQPGETISL